MLMKEIYSLTQKPYPKRLIFKVVGYSSSTWYEKPSPKTGKRGRKPIHSDEIVLREIKAEISNSVFKSEGYIKVKKRMERRPENAIIAAKERVNKLMRENDLLSPNRMSRRPKKNDHKGRIITERPNKMWATDGKKFWVNGTGWHWFFGVIEHFNDEVLAWHIAKKGNRFAAMEPVRSAIREQFGSVDKDVCKGMELLLRSDHGSQYDSADFMNEMKFLGLGISKAYVRSPECNGIIERFHRTLEEELFQIKSFNSIEEAHSEIGDFINKYNKYWIMHRLDCYSPVEYREKYIEVLKNDQSNTSGNNEPEDQLVLLLSGSIPRKKENVHQKCKGVNLADIPLSEILRFKKSPSDQLVRHKNNKN